MKYIDQLRDRLQDITAANGSPSASVYPHYLWRIIRPWFFLWLICWPKIVNNAKAAALCGALPGHRRRPVFDLAATSGTTIRIWRWVRKGRRLTRHIDSQFDGYMI